MYSTIHYGNYMHPQLQRGMHYPSPLRGGGTYQLGALKLPTLSGLVAKYDNPYHHGGKWEIIRRGAFSSLLCAKPEVEIRLMHKSEFSLPGRVKLNDSAEGLLCNIYLADTKLARDLIHAMSWGYLTWLSPDWPGFRYTLEKRNGETYRSIYHIPWMPEVSFCDSPAQDVTHVGIDGERRLSEPMGLPSDPAERRRLREFLSSVGALNGRKTKPRAFPTHPSRSKLATRRQSKRASWEQLSADLIDGFGGRKEFAKVLQNLSRPPIPNGCATVTTSWGR